MFNQQLTDYVRQQKTAGESDEEIRRKLIENGWKEDDIKSCFADLNPPNDTPVYIAERPPMTEFKQPETEVIVKRSKGNLIGVIIILLLGISLTGSWLIYWKLNQKINSPGNNNTDQKKVVSPVNNTMEYQNYNNQVNGFSMQYPKDWKVEENSSPGIIVNMLNPNPDTDNGNRFAANVNVVSEDTGKLSLADYIVLSKKVLVNSFTDYKSVTEKNKTVNGKEAVIIEATYQMGVYQLHNLQMFIVYNGKAFVVTGTSLNSAWDNYKNILETVISSFALK